MKKFVCKVWGHVHEGTAAPDICPVCKAPASEFAEQPAKKGMFSDKNGNPYIIMYSTVMVVVVATLLAVAALGLQARQNANMLNEKKQAILSSLAADGADYNEFVSAYAVDAEGRKIENISADETLQLLFDLKGAFENGTYPVFEAADGRVVVPVTGTGLWGPIWGYVALEKDMNTVAGVVFGHQGETPGLGAEIATPKHWAQYVGKTVFEDNELVAVKLKKGGATPGSMHEVDAISGGTKTSDGVTAMLYNSMEHYLPLLEAKRKAAVEQVVFAPVRDESNEENVENNE